DALAIGQLMAVRRHRAIRRRLRNSWSQAAMWAAAIVMRDPSGQDVAHMRFGERNEEVQTLAPNRTYQPLAKCVCLRRLNRPRGGPLDPSSPTFIGSAPFAGVIRPTSKEIAVDGFFRTPARRSRHNGERHAAWGCRRAPLIHRQGHRLI